MPLVALGVSIPLRLLLPKVGSFNFPWLVGAIAILGLFYKAYIEGEYTITPLDLPLFVLLVAHAVSMFSTPLSPSALRGYLSIVAALGVYFLVTNLVDTEREYHLLVNALLVVGAFLGGVTFYFLLTGRMPFFVPVERLYRVANAGPGGRFWGTMSSPSSFGLFFVFLIPLALGRAVNSRGFRQRAGYLVLALVFAVSMTTTLDRSSILGASVSTLVFTAGIVSFGCVSKRTVATGVSVLAVPGSVVLYVTGFIQGLYSRVAGGNFGGRPERFRHAIELGITHPFGVGRGPALLDALARAGAPPKKVHNVLLGVFAQTGYLGLIALIWIIVGQIRMNLSLVLSDCLSRKRRVTLLSTLSGIAGYWPYSMFHFKYDWGFIFLYFGVNMAYIKVVGD